MQMVRAQNRTIELDGLLAEFGEQEKKTNAELNKKNEDVARLEAEVTELRKKEALAKKKAIEEFKSSDPWLANTLVRSSTSARYKILCLGFDHHPWSINDIKFT